MAGAKDFNQSLQGVPDSLVSLSFGFHFDQPLVGVQWPQLKSLMLGFSFNQSLEEANLPETLQVLALGYLAFFGQFCVFSWQIRRDLV